MQQSRQRNDDVGGRDAWYNLKNNLGQCRPQSPTLSLMRA